MAGYALGMRRGFWALLAVAGCTFGQSDLADSVASVGANNEPMTGTTSTPSDDTTGAALPDPSTTGSNVPDPSDDGMMTASDGGTTSADGGSTTDGAEQTSTSSSSGDDNYELIKDGVVVRYFLDDYGPGAPPDNGSAKDVGPNPVLDLPFVKQGGQPSYETQDGNSGIAWTNVSNNGRAVAPVVDTKIMDLDGASEVTLEFVADVETANGAGTRFIHIGTGSAHSLALSAYNETSMHLRTHTSLEAAVWDANLSNGRTVYTVVVDLSLMGEKRYRLFVNGSEVATTSFQDTSAVQIDSGHSLSIGNRTDGSRAMIGTLFYAAIYDRALSEAEVKQNADALGVSDDSQ